jgi:excisionase family DNA binding protein
MTAATTTPVFQPLLAISLRFGFSVDTLRQLIRQGTLTAYKPNGKILLDVAEVESFVRAAKVAHCADGAGGTEEK